MSYDKRYIASVLIEAETPLRTGGGHDDILLDSPVLRDYNGLPMILGSSIAGVLRNQFRRYGGNKKEENDLFGYQVGNDGLGSRLIVSNAHLVDETGKTVETLLIQKSGFLERFDMLPIRDHVRINDRGVAENHGKFDEEVCYKGSRWRFEMELMGDEGDQRLWGCLLTMMKLPTFRLGGGTRKGYGRIKIVSIHERVVDVDSEDYIARSASLNDFDGKEVEPKPYKEMEKIAIRYRLTLEPDDFFMFGSGIGDDDRDMTPIKEPMIVWETMRKANFEEEWIVVPASSIKGTLSHRTAFYYNAMENVWAEEIIPQGKREEVTGENNGAVAALFGKAKAKAPQKGHQGRVILSDLYLKRYDEKVFDHVKIDRFTGGAKDSALFQEKVVHIDEKLILDLLVEKPLNADEHEMERFERYMQALERAMQDLAKGYLPLGGGVNRGHGVFKGKIEKNGEVLS